VKIGSAVHVPLALDAILGGNAVRLIGGDR